MWRAGVAPHGPGAEAADLWAGGGVVRGPPLCVAHRLEASTVQAMPVSLPLPCVGLRLGRSHTIEATCCVWHARHQRALALPLCLVQAMVVVGGLLGGGGGGVVGGWRW